MKNGSQERKTERSMDIIFKKFGYKKKKYNDFHKALIRIKPSTVPGGGVGVFAVRDLKPNTIVGDVKYMSDDLFFPWDEFKKIDKESQGVILTHCIGTVDGFFGPADINHIPLSWHINHKCDNNVGFDPKGNFITIKKIKKGEELFYDYGLSISDPKYKMKCNCGSKNCRKVVTGNDWKEPKYRKKKSKYMLSELKEYIRLTTK